MRLFAITAAARQWLLLIFAKMKTTVKIERREKKALREREREHFIAAQPFISLAERERRVLLSCRWNFLNTILILAKACLSFVRSLERGACMRVRAQNAIQYPRIDYLAGNDMSRKMSVCACLKEKHITHRRILSSLKATASSQLTFRYTRNETRQEVFNYSTKRLGLQFFFNLALRTATFLRQ